MRSGIEFSNFGPLPLVAGYYTRYVDGLSIDTYNYTIIVWDEYGNSATDTVIVTVEDTAVPTLSNPADITIVFIVIGVIAISTIVYIIHLKKRKQI